jgi:hypothetical protein
MAAYKGGGRAAIATYSATPINVPTVPGARDAAPAPKPKATRQRGSFQIPGGNGQRSMVDGADAAAPDSDSSAAEVVVALELRLMDPAISIEHAQTRLRLNVADVGYITLTA